MVGIIPYDSPLNHDSWNSVELTLAPSVFKHYYRFKHLRILVCGIKQFHQVKSENFPLNFQTDYFRDSINRIR